MSEQCFFWRNIPKHIQLSYGSDSMTKFLFVYTHRSAATFMDFNAIASASISGISISPLAQASAKVPPDPIAIIPSGGSITSPAPVNVRDTFASVIIIVASNLRKYLSVRQALAISTQALINWPLYCSSFISTCSTNAMQSAVAPANPAMIGNPASRRTFLAFGFTRRSSPTLSRNSTLGSRALRLWTVASTSHRFYPPSIQSDSHCWSFCHSSLAGQCFTSFRVLSDGSETAITMNRNRTPNQSLQSQPLAPRDDQITTRLRSAPA